ERKPAKQFSPCRAFLALRTMFAHLYARLRTGPRNPDPPALAGTSGSGEQNAFARLLSAPRSKTGKDCIRRPSSNPIRQRKRPPDVNKNTPMRYAGAA